MEFTQKKAWLVNGKVSASDGNFLRPFHISEVQLNNKEKNKTEGRLFFGSYPAKELDLLDL